MESGNLRLKRRRWLVWFLETSKRKEKVHQVVFRNIRPLVLWLRSNSGGYGPCSWCRSLVMCVDEPFATRRWVSFSSGVSSEWQMTWGCSPAQNCCSQWQCGAYVTRGNSDLFYKAKWNWQNLFPQGRGASGSRPIRFRVPTRAMLIANKQFVPKGSTRTILAARRRGNTKNQKSYCKSRKKQSKNSLSWFVILSWRRLDTAIETVRFAACLCPSECLWQATWRPMPMIKYQSGYRL